MKYFHASIVLAIALSYVPTAFANSFTPVRGNIQGAHFTLPNAINNLRPTGDYAELDAFTLMDVAGTFSPHLNTDHFGPIVGISGDMLGRSGFQRFSAINSSGAKSHRGNGHQNRGSRGKGHKKGHVISVPDDI